MAGGGGVEGGQGGSHGGGEAGARALVASETERDEGYLFVVLIAEELPRATSSLWLPASVPPWLPGTLVCLNT